MYRYETHLHTSVGSACSDFTPEEIVEKYTRLGYAGIFVSDHFLNGNTTVPRDLPWKERIALFCEGYRRVKKQAEGSGLDVFFAWEYSYKGTDFLVYNLGGEWLAEHSEIMDMRVTEFGPYAKEHGGLVVQAHPYREDFYIDHIRLFPRSVEGMETLNACRREHENKLADIACDVYGLSKTAGSDIHHKAQTFFAGMEFETKLTSEADYAERIRKGEGKIFTLRD